MDFSLLQTKNGGISASTLKFIAIFGMTMDHTGIVFGDYLPFWAKIILFAFGGLTFPTMAFLLVEGYKHTSDLKRYALRLLLFAIISLIPFMWAMHSPGLNVMFTLLLGLITLYLYDHMKNRTAFWCVFVLLSLVSAVMDWSLMGVPMVLMYYVLKGKWRKIIIPALLPIGFILVKLVIGLLFFSSIVDILPSVAFACIGCSFTVPLLAAYNGHRGRSLKYIFYMYYPGHLFILVLLRGGFVSGLDFF